jgi:hypothetical protein
MSVAVARVGAMESVQFGPRDNLGYHRPPVTASFADLRRRGLPEALFVHAFLPEGLTICDVNTFAVMIEEAYNPPRTLLIDAPDEHGDQLCRGVGNNGIWEWALITPRRAGWTLTLASEHDGTRQATLKARIPEKEPVEDRPTVATFPISTRLAGQLPAVNLVQLGPLDAMGYRRPPVTVSFDDLQRRGLPRILFVNRSLPEGVTVCDIKVFAAMIKEAYREGDLRFVRQDEHGNDQCVGLGGTGIWEWWASRPSKPIDGQRYASPYQPICRILFAPEQDGKRTCTVDLNGYPGHEPEDDSPIMFTIRVRPMSMAVLEREAAAGADPADVAEGVDVTLSWVAERSKAMYGLLRMLACLPDMPVPLMNLVLHVGQQPATLPGATGTETAETETAETETAAAVLGPLLNNPIKASDPMNALHHQSLVRHVVHHGVQVHPLARAAVRERLTAEEAAHWQQAGEALVEAALPADPQDPATWPTYQRLLPLARATLDPASEGMTRIARYLAASGRNEPPDVTPQTRRRPR